MWNFQFVLNFYYIKSIISLLDFPLLYIRGRYFVSAQRSNMCILKIIKYIYWFIILASKVTLSFNIWFYIYIYIYIYSRHHREVYKCFQCCIEKTWHEVWNKLSVREKGLCWQMQGENSLRIDGGGVFENFTTNDETMFYFDTSASLTTEICKQNTNPGSICPLPLLTYYFPVFFFLLCSHHCRWDTEWPKLCRCVIKQHWSIHPSQPCKW